MITVGVRVFSAFPEIGHGNHYLPLKAVSSSTNFWRI